MPEQQIQHTIDELIRLAARSPSPPADLFSNAQRFMCFYTEYEVVRLIRTKSGLFQMPVAASTGYARLVRMHAPYTKMMVVWRAQRVGGLPVLPDPDTSNPNETIDEVVICPQGPMILPGGKTLIHSCQGYYTYFCQAALRSGDIYQMPAITPVVQIAVEKLNADGYTFDKTILKTVVPQDYSSLSAKVVD